MKQDKTFGQAELTGCPFMSSVEKHWLGVTPPCQSQKAFNVNTCFVVLIIIDTGRPQPHNDFMSSFSILSTMGVLFRSY